MNMSMNNSNDTIGNRTRDLPTQPTAPSPTPFNPLNPELNPICYLLALLGAHHFSTLAG